MESPEITRFQKEITRFQKEIEDLTEKVSSLSLENANYQHKIKELQETIIHLEETIEQSKNSSHSASNFILNSNQVIKEALLKRKKMDEKIWSVLAQILYYRNDLCEIIKPFFENLHNKNINDENYIPVLKTFPKDQLEGFYKNGIITKEKFNSLFPKNQSLPKVSTIPVNENNNTNIEEIISGDKIQELQELIQEKDIKTFNIIKKSFFEVKEMKIPLIQYCIMKNAIECFKYLLVNGYDDPNKTMEEQNPESFTDLHYNKIEIKKYEWDCMATAIYFGNKEIMKILEEKGIEKGKNPSHVEAAILSYRNIIAKEIIDDLSEKKEQIQNILNISILASAKSNNIKGVEFLIEKGAYLNTYDEGLNSFQKII